MNRVTSDGLGCADPPAGIRHLSPKIAFAAQTRASTRCLRSVAGQVELPAEPGRDDAANATRSRLSATDTPTQDQARQHQRRDDHRTGIDDVVGGDRARRFGLGHGRGQEGIERHDEHAAGDRDAEQVEHDRPAVADGAGSSR